MKKMIKVILIGSVLMVAILALLFVIWVIMSPGTIRQYTEEKSLSEKFVMDVNGAPNGFFINSRNTDNPVLLFVSSGPGTDDYMFTDKYKDMNLENDFTVVYWDYRNMGIAYDKSYDITQITLENIMNDVQTVTEYLKERFSKEKIYLMGFSGGTTIALRAAAEHPEDYIALIDMAQSVTNSYERDTYMYNFMKKVFTERGDKVSLKKLEMSVKQLGDGNVKCDSWIDYVELLHHAGGGTILNQTEFEGIVLPILFCKCYTVKEKLNYVPAMKKYRTTPFYQEVLEREFDFRIDIPELQIPAYFISGETDYNCPWELVKDYCDKLKAPDKAFYIVSDSAHCPLWENPEVTCAVMREIKEKRMDE